MSRTWLISGCSTGIGRLLAERALAEGDRVVATARKPETLADIGADCEDRVLRHALDVTSSDSIREVVAAARERFDDIDVLVNNAGVGYFSTQEEADLAGVRAMYEVNVFGLIALTQVVIPRMRERETGTVINISSMAGHMATPRGGFYQSSKWAVEALSECLSLELGNFGVRVIAVEPGRYETSFSTSVQLGPEEQNPESPYAALRERWHRGAMELYPEFQNPAEVVEATWNALQNDALLQRIPVGNDAIQVVEQRQALGDAGFAEWMREQWHPV